MISGEQSKRVENENAVILRARVFEKDEIKG
jgi:hypothetical protein